MSLAEFGSIRIPKMYLLIRCLRFLLGISSPKWRKVEDLNLKDVFRALAPLSRRA